MAGADLTLFGNPKEAEHNHGKKRKPAAQPEHPSPYSACKYACRPPAAQSSLLCPAYIWVLMCCSERSPVDVAIMRLLDESGDPAAILARRSSAFKVIPRIPEGSWVIKQAVGSTPVLMGNKLTTQFHRCEVLQPAHYHHCTVQYLLDAALGTDARSLQPSDDATEAGQYLSDVAYRGPRYLEVDLDVGSSRSAAHVVSLVSGALKSLVIDLGIVLEGRFWVSPSCMLPYTCTALETLASGSQGPCSGPKQPSHLPVRQGTIKTSTQRPSCPCRAAPAAT